MKRFVAIFVAVALLFTLTGCVVNTFKSSDGDWSIQLDKEFAKGKQVKDEKLKITTTTFRNEAGTEIDLSESNDPKFVLNKDTFAAELEMDTLLKVAGMYEVESKAGTVYVARVTDGISSMRMIYGITKINDKVVTVMMYQNSAFTDKQETAFKKMLGSIKKLK